MNHTCSSQSMARLTIRDRFVINGDEEPVTVGDNLEITCTDKINGELVNLLFTKDIWDGNSTDNTLHIKCRSDQNFDVPSSDNLPECLAQCSAEKPMPPVEYNITLDDTRTSPDQKIWEREELW